MPFFPASNPDQKASLPMPIGVIGPTPVTTILFFKPTDSFPSALTLVRCLKLLLQLLKYLMNTQNTIDARHELARKNKSRFEITLLRTR